MIKSLFNKISENLPVVAILLVATLVSGWASNTYLVDPEGTREYLDKELKFTDIEIGNHAWVGCDSDSPFSVDTRFTATDTNGKRVSGAYCDGLFPYHVIYKHFVPN